MTEYPLIHANKVPKPPTPPKPPVVPTPPTPPAPPVKVVGDGSQKAETLSTVDLPAVVLINF